MTNTPGGGVPPIEPPSDHEPTQVLPQAEPPDRSNATNWLLGAILIVLLAIGGLLIFRQSSGETATTTTVAAADTTTTSADQSTTSPEETTTTSEPESTTTSADTTTTSVAETTTTTVETTTTTTELSPDEADAATALTDWIAAIAAGDAESAWNLLAAESQAGVGGREGFDDLFTALQEGYGAWNAAAGPFGDGDPWIIVNEVDDATYVVTLVGTVTQEGLATQDAVATPVIVVDGAYLVQPFTRGELVTFVTPPNTDPPSALAPDSGFEVTVPAGTESRLFVGDAALGVSIRDNGDGTQTVVGDPTSLEAGSLEVLTVLYRGDGVVHAEAVLFFVAEGS